MSSPFWHGLSDDQLAEMMLLMQRVENLNALLLAEQNKVTFLNNQLANEHAKCAGMEADFRADFDRMAKELQEVADEGLKARNKLFHLTQHLPAILSDWLAPFAAFSDEALTPEFRERRKNVSELLRVLDPFAQ